MKYAIWDEVDLELRKRIVRYYEEGDKADLGIALAVDAEECCPLGIVGRVRMGHLFPPNPEMRQVAKLLMGSHFRRDRMSELEGKACQFMNDWDDGAIDNLSEALGVTSCESGSSS